MSPRTAHVPNLESREQILAAALARFQHYGYNKTTMAEIADDAHMSAANLYRYFDSKLDMAAACCNVCMEERLERLRAVARRPDSLPRKLDAYVIAMIEHTHEIAITDTKISELIQTVSRERPKMIHDRLRAHYALLAEILQLGNDSGEFEVVDVGKTARYLYSALVIFDVPIFVGLFSRQEFEERAHGVVSLLLNGLRKR